LYVPFYQGLLAEIEAQDDVARALTRIDEGLALAGETGEHWNDAFLHRLRAEILLKRDPANTVAAEEHFSRLSPLRRSRKSCEQLSVWRDSTIPRAVPQMLMPCWRLRSRASRRHPNLPRSKKRKRFSSR
jgi:predicted ATPase